MVKKLLTISAYILLGVFIAGTTFVLVKIGQGYSYDFKTNSFQLEGLMVLTSSPQASEIYVNGKSIHRRTPYRSTYQAGDYDVEVRRQGHRPWRKKLTIRASEVTAPPSILLIPEEIKTQTLAQDLEVSAIRPSKDHRHFAFTTTGASPGVWLLSVDRKEHRKIFTPKLASDGKPAEAIEALDWSDDASRLLVRTVVAEKVFYNLVSAEPDISPINLTELFKFDFSNLVFAGGNAQELYWMSPEGLRRLNVEDRTVSAVIADKVSAFTFAGDRLLYIQSTPLGKSVWSLDKNGREPRRLLESIADSETYQMTYASYRGKDFLAILPHKSGTVTVYGDIFSTSPVSKVVAKNAGGIAFNEDGQFLSFYAADTLGAYDTDSGVIYSTRHEQAIGAVSWFDESHVLYRQNGKVMLAEFDGANAYEVNEAVTGSAAYGTSDKRFVLSLTSGSKPGTVNITSAEIK